MSEDPDHIRIFMVDQSQIDLILTIPWEVLLHTLITQGCILSNTAWINRASILRVMRFRPGAPDTRFPAEIIDFPTPKENA